MVALACQLHRREHGAFPEKLEGLIGASLDAIPIDPYSPAGEPLRYRRDGEEAVVWSIGENGTDDSGDVDWPPAPSVMPARPRGAIATDIGFRIQPPK
jgi:hypothetical protein